MKKSMKPAVKAKKKAFQASMKGAKPPTKGNQASTKSHTSSSTRTSTVANPHTQTSTVANPRHNVTVTGGAGDGATTVIIGKVPGKMASGIAPKKGSSEKSKNMKAKSTLKKMGGY